MNKPIFSDTDTNDRDVNLDLLSSLNNYNIVDILILRMVFQQAIFGLGGLIVGFLLPVGR